MATLEELLLSARSNADQWLTGQKATAQSSYDAEVNALRKALELGVTEQNQLSGQAKRDYENQVAQINQQVYNDSQLRQSMGYGAGMQNSQQFLAQMSGDQYRRQQMDAGVAKDRDARLGDIANRIASLKTQTDFDLSSALSGYNSRLAGLSSEAENMYNNNVLSLREKQLEQEYALQRMQQEYAMASRSAGSPGGGGTPSGVTQTTASPTLAKSVSQYNTAVNSTPLDAYYKSQVSKVSPVKQSSALNTMAKSGMLKTPAKDKNLTQLQVMNMMTNKSPNLKATAKKTTTARKNQLR